VRRNSQHRSPFDCCLSHYCTSGSTSSSSVKLLPPRWNRFTWQTLRNVNRKHFFMNILCIESSCPQKTHSITQLLSSTLLKHGRHFDYWNQPLNMRMRVCYLVMYIENIHVLRPLQLFYFHLWPIYWLSLVRYVMPLPVDVFYLRRLALLSLFGFFDGIIMIAFSCFVC
jgi:hypothetical protein